MAADDPYCRNCGYTLTGLTDSSKCPECGKPLVEVLTRPSASPAWLRHSRRYRSAITLWGLPLVHVALGPGLDGQRGKATGIIAIGDIARGFFALGNVAFGVVAAGGMGIGLFSLGGFAAGLFALGGSAAGGLAMGGGAVGIVAAGGGAIGGVAIGGGVVGYYAAGGGVTGRYVISPTRRDPEAVDLFTRLSWLVGDLGANKFRMLQWLALVGTALAACIGMLVLITYIRHRPREAEP